jgi:hypothetical protein
MRWPENECLPENKTGAVVGVEVWVSDYWTHSLKSRDTSTILGQPMEAAEAQEDVSPLLSHVLPVAARGSLVTIYSFSAVTFQPAVQYQSEVNESKDPVGHQQLRKTGASLKMTPGFFGALVSQLLHVRLCRHLGGWLDEMVSHLLHKRSSHYCGHPTSEFLRKS